MHSLGRRVLAPALVLFMALAVGLPSLTYPFGRDQGAHAIIASESLKGKIVYLQVFSDDLPGSHLVHAASQVLFGRSMLSIRLLDLIWQSATACLIYLIGRRMALPRHAAIVAGVIYSVWYYSFDFWNTAQTDGWESLFAALAIFGYMRASEKPKGWLYLCSGAAIGVAVLLKYPVGVLVLFLSAMRLRERDPHRWRDVLILMTGLALPLVICTVMLSLQGALRPLIETQARYITNYSLGRSATFGYSYLMGRSIGHLTMPALLLWPGLVLLATMCIAPSASVPRGTTVIAAWFASALVSFFIQGKGFTYHALPMIAPVALMTGQLLAQLALRGRSRLANLLLVAVLECALLIPTALFVQNMLHHRVGLAVRSAVASGMDYEKIASVSGVADTAEPGFSFLDELNTARYISDRTSKTDTLFVWGFDCSIYFLSAREPASRFVYNLELSGDWSWPELREQLMLDLAANRPAYIVVASEDALPLVTGSFDDSATALTKFPELQAYLDTNYAYEVSFGNLALYRRVGRP